VLLGRIQRQIDRLATLVERLLDTARLNAGELPLDYAEADLGALCRDAVEHARLTDRDHVFRFLGEPSLPGRFDASRLEQVLTNLIGNAGRYSPAGSEITVRLTRHGEHARIDVVDQGMGIAEEQLPKLFTPFYRGAAAARYKGGLGLGLYITREIVRRHAGELRVSSDVGRGSTFTVELPLEPR
jgi:signal transduction histidine kinase